MAETAHGRISLSLGPHTRALSKASLCSETARTRAATMRAVRTRGAVTAVLLAIGLASCASAPAGPLTPGGVTIGSQKGAVSGFADSCSGLMEQSHVRVLLYSGRRLLATETVRSGTGYRFVVAPGSYRVMAGHRVDEVEVRPGRTTTASLLMVCL